MDAPRFATSPRAVALAAMLAALLGPTLARADRAASDNRGRVNGAPPVRNEATRISHHREREPARRPSCDDDRPEEAITLPPALLLHCLRLLHALQSVCVLSGDMLAWMSTTPPLVVKPPPPPKPSPPLTPGITEEPPTEHSPEPGTLVGGLVASVVGLAAWCRRRRSPDTAA